MLLEKRPETLEAIQFKSGVEGAQAVIEWVRARDPHTIVSWTPEILNDGEPEIKEALFVIVSDRSRYMAPERQARSSTRQFRVNPDQWLVLDKTHRVSYPTDGFDLFKAYKEVPDEDARPS